MYDMESSPNHTNASSSEEQVSEIDINAIDFNDELNPRKSVSDAHLAQITKSMSTHGLWNPILLWKKDGLDNYLVISGAVRLKAAKALGWTKILSRILPIDEEEAQLLAIKTNLEPEDHDLTSIEIATAIRDYCTASKMTQNEVAEKLDMTNSRVSRFLSLLDTERTDTSVIHALEERNISTEHAFEIIRLPIDAQKPLVDEVLSTDLSKSELRKKINQIEDELAAEKIAPAQQHEWHIRLLWQAVMDISLGINTRLDDPDDRTWNFDQCITSILDAVGTMDPKLAKIIIDSGGYPEFMRQYLGSDEGSEGYLESTSRWRILREKYSAKALSGQ